MVNKLNSSYSCSADVFLFIIDVLPKTAKQNACFIEMEN